MLTHDMTDDGKFRVTETTMSLQGTKVKTVVYSADLMEVQVNDDPVRPTTEAARDWFERHHRHKYTHETV